MKPGHFQETARESSDSVVDYRDGTKAAVYSVQGVGWTYAGDIEGRKDPTIVSMLGWPGPYSQYHAANAFEPLLKKYDGQLFQFGNADLVMVTKDADNEEIDKVVAKVRYLFRLLRGTGVKSTKLPRKSLTPNLLQLLKQRRRHT